MRRSSSTTIRCGASSAGTTARADEDAAMDAPPATASAAAPARRIRARDEIQHAGPILCIDDRCEEFARGFVRTRADIAERPRQPCGLQPGELHGQRFTFVGDEEESLAAVTLAFLLHHVAFVD